MTFPEAWANARFALNALNTGKDAGRSPTSIVAGNRTEDGRNCHRRANGYEDHGQHRVAMPSIVIDVLHVCITNGCGSVGLAIAHDEIFIAGAVNIALHFRAIIQRDRRARFRADAEFGDVFFAFSTLAASLAVFCTAANDRVAGVKINRSESK